MTLDEMNLDQMRDDIKIIWCAKVILLTLAGKVLTTLSIDGVLQKKIERWCDKNNYRCTQVHDGKIWL